MTASTPPIRPAYPTTHGLKVWCVYCHRWHQHGQSGGHRAAHCHVPSSPYRRSGYILAIVDPSPTGGAS